MAITSTVAAVAGVATTVGTTIAAQNKREDAAEQQNNAAQRAQAQQEVDNARKRRQAVAQQRIQQGQINNAAAQAGATGSSGATGAAAALTSDFRTGVTSFEGQIASNSSINDSLSEASRLSSQADSISAYGQLAGSVLGSADQIGEGIAKIKDQASQTGNLANTSTQAIPGFDQPSPSFRKL